MQDVALTWLVVNLTNSPIALGTTIAIRFLPSLVLSLFGGVIADRLPKRNTLLLTQSAQLVVALALAALTSTGLITVGVIYVLAAIRGVLDAVDGPSRQAFVPELVGKENVINAVALNSAQFNVARVAGPAVGAALVATLGLAACFYANAASFLAVIVALLLMRVSEFHPVARAPHGGVLRQMREGFSYARRTPDILLVLMVMAFIGTFGYNFSVLLPLVTRYLLHSVGEKPGATTLAFLTTAMGVGAVLAAMTMAYRRQATRRVLMGAAACFSVFLVVLAFSGSLPVTMGLMFFVGFCGVMFMTTANTRLQLGTSGHIRGRVMGIYTLLFLGTTPIGSELVGQLAQRMGTKPTVLMMGGLCALGVIAGAAFLVRIKGRPAVEQGLLGEDAADSQFLVAEVQED